MKKNRATKKYIIAALLILALIAGGILIGMKTTDIADGKDTGTAKTTEKKDVKEEDKTKSKDDEANKEEGKKEEDKASVDKTASSDDGASDTANNGDVTNNASAPSATNNNAATGGSTYTAPAKQSSTTSTSTQLAKPAHTHNWVPHYATRNVQKTVTVYEWETYTACNACNADVTGNAVSHAQWEASKPEGERSPYAGGWHSAQRQVPRQVTETVQEKYVDYSYCSGCGARK